MDNKKDVTYCKVCGDGWCDENYLLGICCGEPLETRKETDEEETNRRIAVARIMIRAEGWIE